MPETRANTGAHAATTARVFRWRLAIALTNLTAAVLLVLVAVYAFVIEPSRPREPIARKPRPFILPGGVAPGLDDFDPAPHEVVADRPPIGPTPAEDRAALEDPQRDFEAAYRVLFVAVDPGGTAPRGCIVASRALGEQVFLIPGEKLSENYLLLSIDLIPGSPRGARLRFSDLRKGAIVEIRLSPVP